MLNIFWTPKRQDMWFWQNFKLRFVDNVCGLRIRPKALHNAHNIRNVNHAKWTLFFVHHRQLADFAICKNAERNR